MGNVRPKGIAETQLVQSNIGEDYWEVDFYNYEGPAKALHVSKTYLEKLDMMKERGVGLLYAGPPGPGKTTIAMIVMKYLARARWDVYTTSLGELVEDIQRSWKNEDADNNTGVQRRSREADFLLIDDVGKEHRGQSGFVQTVFDNLIRYRAQRRKPTFLTTNLTKSELKGTYGESVMSLLEGKLLPVEVDGNDHRIEKLKKQNKEAIK